MYSSDCKHIFSQRNLNSLVTSICVKPVLLLDKSALLSTTSRLCTLLWLQTSPVTSEERRLHNLPFLFYFPPNLCRSPETVMGKPGSSEFADQESQKNNETCAIITAQSNTSSFKQRKQNLKKVSLPLVKLPAMWFMAGPLFLVTPNKSWVLLEKVDCNYQSNKYEFPSQFIFPFTWQWSHPSQNQLHIALETTGYLNVARMHHLPDSLSFSSATLPTLCC